MAITIVEKSFQAKSVYKTVGDIPQTVKAFRGMVSKCGPHIFLRVFWGCATLNEPYALCLGNEAPLDEFEEVDLEVVVKERS